MTPWALQARSLGKHFGPRPVLDIPGLRLEAGRCVLLSGRNGAGKSTLLRILAGLERPDPQTEIDTDGTWRPWHRARRALRRDVTYLHQHAYLFDATVEANAAYGLRVAWTPSRQWRARVSEALRLVDLDHLAGARAGTLSGGERQRLALARAWVLKPRLLLLDEPTASMDREARDRTARLLARLKSDKLCMVITSHEPHTLASLPDDHLQLVDGRLHAAPLPQRPPLWEVSGAGHAAEDPASSPEPRSAALPTLWELRG
ncbi:MAG: ABC transporter ATP-binding protein [Gammaproteobacteria bacterium]